MGVVVLGRTIPSYRMALENEIQKWKRFTKALPSRSEREAFEELMNHCRRYASAGGMAVRPILSEAMFMSILLTHEKTLRKLEAELEKLQLDLCKSRE